MTVEIRKYINTIIREYFILRAIGENCIVCQSFYYLNLVPRIIHKLLPVIFYTKIL
jgi:hypothetical protein